MDFISHYTYSETLVVPLIFCGSGDITEPLRKVLPLSYILALAFLFFETVSYISGWL